MYTSHYVACDVEGFLQMEKSLTIKLSKCKRD